MKTAEKMQARINELTKANEAPLKAVTRRPPTSGRIMMLRALGLTVTVTVPNSSSWYVIRSARHLDVRVYFENS